MYTLSDVLAFKVGYQKYMQQSDSIQVTVTVNIPDTRCKS